MITFPNAKLNLGLDILRKRPDGYHDLESLFIPYDGLRDVLEIVPTTKMEMEMHLYGMPLEGDPMDNLCVKAWKLLHERFDIPPVAIYLWKGIPSGAGLGGGSADASFTLAMLNEIFLLRLQTAEMAEMAATLGSDCPFFIYNRPMMASGRGEILKPYRNLDLSGYRIEVVKPDVFVSTREAYAGVRPHLPETPLEEILSRPVGQWRSSLVNDFEESIFPAHPEIEAVKRQFYERGAVYAAMSGSGSAVFGIFRKDE